MRRPMALLDEDEGKWYCYEHDVLYFAKEQRWNDDTLTETPGICDCVNTPTEVCELRRLNAGDTLEFAATNGGIIIRKGKE